MQSSLLDYGFSVLAFYKTAADLRVKVPMILIYSSTLDGYQYCTYTSCSIKPIPKQSTVKSALSLKKGESG